MRIRVQHSHVTTASCLIFFSVFLHRHFAQTVQARTVSPPDPDFGTEDPPLYSLENERNINLILKKDDSAALSLLNKVFSSISPKGDKM